jgi:hypothetical protein
MAVLLRPLLVFLAVVVVIVLLVVLLLGGFGGDGDDKQADKTKTTEQQAPAGTISAQDLKIGTCITDARSTTGDVMTFIGVDCSKPHDGEVYTLIEVGGTKYPGKERVTAKGNRGCRARLKRQATGKALSDRNLAPYRFVYPTPASWAQDYRSITCLVTYTKQRRGKLEQR